MLLYLRTLLSLSPFSNIVQAHPTQFSKVVVSLGTGHYKSEEFEGCSVYRWKHPGDLLRDVIGVVDILKVMAQQV